MRRVGQGSCSGIWLAVTLVFLPMSLLAGVGGGSIRLLEERRVGHIRFLATGALVGREGVSIPPVFSVPLVNGLVDAIFKEGVGVLRDFWAVHGDELLSDERLFREFVLLLIALYHNLIPVTRPFARCSPVRCGSGGCAAFGGSPARGIPWLSLVAIYMRLSAIPLDKLFDVLDECYRYYKAILDEYATMQDGHASLADWWAEYWWLPVLFVGMGLTAFIRWMRNRPRVISTAA
ncbi:MAG: hypothetical protein M1549_01120 [Candidatus Dependentiae bacterium]|nr:hypothetical protein [Candidatus Dependentiae bacterium]